MRFVLFDYPEEGTYLDEAEAGQRIPLMNEEWDDQDCASDASDAVPVRILKDFVFFDPRTSRLVPLSSLYEDGFCEGFGWAVAGWDEEDQDDAIYLHLSNVLKWELDIQKPHILVLTEYAWYILKTPSSLYRPFFIPFYTTETLLRIVLRNILRNPALSAQQFFRLLSLPEAHDYILDRCWTEEDLASNFQYSRRELQDIISEFPDISWKKIKNAPLLDALLRDSGALRSSTHTQKHQKPPRMTSRTKRPVPSPSAALQHKQKAKPRTFRTTVTPLVHSLISSFFDIKFTVVSQKPAFLDESILLRERPRDQESTEVADGLKPGDFVIVNEGDHVDQSQIRQANFAQIVYLESRGKMFHARWFIHGSETILEELAFGQELFLSAADDCRDVSIDCVVNKCAVAQLSLEERSNLQWPPKNTYFFSSVWNKNHPTDFVEVTNDQIHIPSSRFCKTCDSRKSASYEFSNSTITIKREEYHKHDYIRYRATHQEELTCSFGQIVAFNDCGGSVQIKVHMLGRISDRRDKGLCVENELFMTRMVVIMDPSMILGRCQVTHVSQFEDQISDCNWVDQRPLSFYVQYQAESFDSPLIPLPITALQTCDVCQQVHSKLDRLYYQCRKEAKLRAFDPFVGCGGFGLGLSRGCSMHTTHGVELDSNAAETMRRNFPSETIVLNKDANLVLRHVVQGQAGVPQYGEVDLIYSGPPCQNDSTLNRHKNDRKCLAFTALSFLEILRPPYFIMESVPGFLHWEVQGSTHRITAGDLKLVLKVLHFLGYNVKGRLLEARTFGDPQTRSRFFLVATLPECGDFSFPEPTHAFRERGNQGLVKSLGRDLKVKAIVSRAGCALHEAVTISAALSDLPLFDWTSTEESAAPKDKVEADARPRNVVAVSCDVGEIWGIQDSTFRYTCPPANYFQYRARRDLGLTGPQYQHFTRQFKSDVVRNVCRVPLIRGADYRHLDQRNREWSMRDPASAKAIHGFQSGAYTRLDPEKYFRTIVTHVGPTAKQSGVLHPICKRIFSVRELARAQGFPDDFVFYSETDKIDDYHKQIGNSVPFGMSAALGRSIQELVFKRWKQRRESL